MAQANRERFDWVHRALWERVISRSPRGTVALWGLTYKKDTRSTKNAPALRLLAEIDPRLTLRAWDPVVGLAELREAGVDVPLDVVGSMDDALDGADVLLIMNDWDVFARADPDQIRRRMRRPLVIDTTGALNGRRAELHGIDYVTMGRSDGFATR